MQDTGLGEIVVGQFRHAGARCHKSAMTPVPVPAVAVDGICIGVGGERTAGLGAAATEANDGEVNEGRSNAPAFFVSERLRRRVHLFHKGTPTCRRASRGEARQGANETALVINLGRAHFLCAIRDDHSA
jgi:hypothetical protein